MSLWLFDRSAIFFKNLCIGWYLKLIGLQQSWRCSYLRFHLHYNGRQFLDALSSALAISLEMRLHRFLCSLHESFEGSKAAISPCSTQISGNLDTVPRTCHLVKTCMPAVAISEGGDLEPKAYVRSIYSQRLSSKICLKFAS